MSTDSFRFDGRPKEQRHTENIQLLHKIDCKISSLENDIKCNEQSREAILTKLDSTKSKFRK
jgi:hypothetical protein